MKRLLLFAFALTACGPPTTRGGEVTPTLPGEDPVEAASKAKPKEVPVKPKEKPKAEPDPWAGKQDLIEPPPLTPAAALKLPPLTKFTLPNGLRVIVVESHGLPSVGFHLAVRAGSGEEGREQRGVADLAATMLTKGSKRRSADQIAQTIDQVGGSLGASADFEATHVTCDVLAKDAAVCLDLVADLAANPAFPDKELDPARKQIVAAIKQRRDDPEALAEDHLENLLWGEDHVRGWPLTIDGVNGLGRAALVDWHAARFRPGNALLVVAGDVQPAAIKAQIEKAFAGWKPGPAPAAKKFAEPALGGVRVRVVDKPDQTQSQILVAGLGIAVGDPDYVPTLLMNYTLGAGAFSSRLMTVVRVEGGKSYGASSRFDALSSRGAFVARTFTRTKETVATLALVRKEIERMQAGGPTAAELADAKANVAGGYGVGFQSASALAGALVRADLHGKDEAWIRDFPLKVAAVTLADVKQAARLRLDGKRAAIVIVGNAREIVPALEKAGYKGVELVDWLAPISKRDRDAAIAAKNAPPDPKKVAEGKKLVDQAVVARGGKAKLTAIKTLKGKGAMKIFAQGRTVDAGLERWYQAPDQQRLDMNLPGRGIASLILTGKAAWLEVRGKAGEPAAQVQDVPADALPAIGALLFAEPERVLLHAYDPGVVVQSLGKQNVDGVEYDAVRIAAPDGRFVEVMLDAKTHLPARVYYEIDGETLFDEYADYKAVGGVQIAHQVKTINLLLQAPVEITYDTIEINPKLPAKAFEK